MHHEEEDMLDINELNESDRYLRRENMDHNTELQEEDDLNERDMTRFDTQRQPSEGRNAPQDNGAKRQEEAKTFKLTLNQTMPRP